MRGWGQSNAPGGAGDAPGLLHLRCGGLVPDGVEEQEGQPDVYGERRGGEDAKHHSDDAQRFPRAQEKRREDRACGKEAKQNNGSTECHDFSSLCICSRFRDTAGTSAPRGCAPFVPKTRGIILPYIHYIGIRAKKQAFDKKRAPTAVGARGGAEFGYLFSAPSVRGLSPIGDWGSFAESKTPSVTLRVPPPSVKETWSSGGGSKPPPYDAGGFSFTRRRRWSWWPPRYSRAG